MRLTLAFVTLLVLFTLQINSGDAKPKPKAKAKAKPGYKNPYGSGQQSSYNHGSSYKRGQQSSYNHGGSYKRGQQSSYNQGGSFASGQQSSYNHGGSYKRGQQSSYNSGGSYKRGQQSSYNNGGSYISGQQSSYNSGGSYKKGQQSSYNSGGSYKKGQQSSYDNGGSYKTDSDLQYEIIFNGEVKLPQGGGVDLGASTWITLLPVGQRIVLKTTDRADEFSKNYNHEYIFRTDGHFGYLNQYKVTAEAWDRLLNREEVTLPNIGKNGPDVITLHSAYKKMEKNGFWQHLKIDGQYMIGAGFSYEVNEIANPPKPISPPKWIHPSNDGPDGPTDGSGPLDDGPSPSDDGPDEPTDHPGPSDDGPDEPTDGPGPLDDGPDGPTDGPGPIDNGTDGPSNTEPDVGIHKPDDGDIGPGPSDDSGDGIEPTYVTKFDGVIDIKKLHKKIDLTSSEWISTLSKDSSSTVTIVITSGGKTFTINSNGGVVTLNGHEIDTETWDVLLKGLPVELAIDDDTLKMQSKFNPSQPNGFLSHLVVNGVHLFGQRHFIQVIVQSNPQTLILTPGETCAPKPGNVRVTAFTGEIPLPGGGLLDMKKPEWVTMVKPGIKIYISSNGKTYTITGNGKRVLINGFKIFASDWEVILAGTRLKVFKESNPSAGIRIVSQFNRNEENSFFANLKFGSTYMFGSSYSVKIVISSTNFIKKELQTSHNLGHSVNWWSQNYDSSFFFGKNAFNSMGGQFNNVFGKLNGRGKIRGGVNSFGKIRGGGNFYSKFSGGGSSFGKFSGGGSSYGKFSGGGSKSYGGYKSRPIYKKHKKHRKH